MTKTIRIASETHQVAKDKARAAGMKLYAFMDMAIRAFQPVITVRPTRVQKSKRAG